MRVFVCENCSWAGEELRRTPTMPPLRGRLIGKRDMEIQITKEAFSFIALLKTCAKNRDLNKGIKLHDDILKMDLLQKNPYLASTLINMYAKCGVLSKARQVLEEVDSRDLVTWSALIAGYAQDGQGQEALNCFDQMQREGLSPDVVTFTCILKACGTIGAINKGEEIHKEIRTRGLLEKDMVLGNALVDMYAKCGRLVKAEEVLKELPFQNTSGWNALIAGYVQHGQCHNAMNCLDQMQSNGLSPDALTYSSILKVCGSTCLVDKGIMIHHEIVNKGLLQKNLVLGTALVDMYAKCGVMEKVKEVLEELPVRDLICWSALIAGYAQVGNCDEALSYFEQMKHEGFLPNAVTFICILKACGSVGAINKGKQFHNEILSKEFLNTDTVLGNALVDMYSKCGALARAQHVLEGLSTQNVAAWNALITGYAQKEQYHDAFYSFERMQSEGLTPDAITFICILKVCGSTGNIDKGKQIHDKIMSRGFVEKDIVVGTALVDMYAKCGELVRAQQVLEDLLVRDVVAWSALISGYVQQGQCHEALSCFEQMQLEGVPPNLVTFICSLNACGSTGAIHKGREIHEEIIVRDLLKKDVTLGNALVDMYSKCGALEKSLEVLEELPIRNVVSWNALIAGYAQQGKGHEALNCFRQMEKEGIAPDDVTFLCALSACSHSGLVDEAEVLFANMTNIYGIAATVGHHTCMVAVFGCAGQFDNAVSVMKVISSLDDPGLWLALLGACRKWANVTLGRLVFDQIIQLYDSPAAAYVLMANIFGAAGLQKDAEKVEAMRPKYTDCEKRWNCMWVDASGKVHSFSFGEREHHENTHKNERFKLLIPNDLRNCSSQSRIYSC